MRIRIGYDIAFSSSTPAPTILLLSVHPSRLNDLTEPHWITFYPPIPSPMIVSQRTLLLLPLSASPGDTSAARNNAPADAVANFLMAFPPKTLRDDVAQHRTLSAFISKRRGGKSLQRPRRRGAAFLSRAGYSPHAGLSPQSRRPRA